MLRSISDHILDIVQNSIEAKSSTVKLTVEEESGRYLKFTVEDDGEGMTSEELSRIFDPFFTSGDKHIRKVGLGLPFLKQSAELTGGYVRVESEKGKGTKVEVLFRSDSVDCPPIGDLPSTLAVLLTNNEVNLKIKRIKDGRVLYELDSADLKKDCGDLLENPSFIKRIIEALSELESS